MPPCNSFHVAGGRTVGGAEQAPSLGAVPRTSHEPGLLNFVTSRLLPLFAATALAACQPGPEWAATETIEPVQNSVDPDLTELDGLDEETLYKLLVAEIAGHQEQHQLALENYLWAARSTDDLSVISRAMSVANFTGDTEAAEELAKMWLRKKPDANRPLLTLAVVALENNDVEQAVRHLKQVMQGAGLATAKIWLIVSALGDFDKSVQLETLARLAEDFTADAETQLAYGRMLLQLGEVWRAEKVFADLLEADPEQQEAAIIYVSTLLDQAQEQQAVMWLERHLRQYPEQAKVRTYHARLLTELGLLREAEEQLRLLQQGEHGTDSNSMLLASVLIETGQQEAAKEELEKLIWVESTDYHDRAAWQLGRLAEDEGQRPLALKWYRSINEPELAAAASIRGIPLQHHGDATATIAAFEQMAETRPHLINQIDEVKAAWLAENGMYDEAMAVYDQAIERDDSPIWRYSRAITAEEYGNDMELFEQDLRHIIDQDASNTEALNALGYTLADRTDRYDEAYGLIYRALLMEPNNFYILDSMGWVLFRLGYNEEAMEYLEKAYAVRPDPEIASHMVHILAASGNKKKAREILRDNARKFPEDEHLEAVRTEFSL